MHMVSSFVVIVLLATAAGGTVLDAVGQSKSETVRLSPAHRLTVAALRRAHMHDVFHPFHALGYMRYLHGRGASVAAVRTPPLQETKPASYGVGQGCWKGCRVFT